MSTYPPKTRKGSTAALEESREISSLHIQGHAENVFRPHLVGPSEMLALMRKIERD